MSSSCSPPSDFVPECPSQCDEETSLQTFSGPGPKEGPFSSPEPGDSYDFIMSESLGQEASHPSGTVLDFGPQDLASDDFHFGEPPGGSPSSPQSFAGGFESDQSPLSSNSEGFHSSSAMNSQNNNNTNNHHFPQKQLLVSANPPLLFQSPSMLQSPSLQSPSLQTFFPQAAHIQVFCPGVQPELHFLSPHLPPKRKHSSRSPSLSPVTPTTTTPNTERRKYSTYAIKTSSLEKLQPNLASLNLTKKEPAKGSSQEGTTDPGSAASSSKTLTPSEVKAETSHLATPSAESEFGSSTRSESPDADTLEFDGGSEDEDDYDGESSMEDDEYDEDGNYIPPAAPSTRIIENKPKRGGRHRRDALRREELLPPPSPRTQNDPGLMQVYRQERNRLAAKRSRERKKDYIKQLEGTCKALKLHNEELSRELLKVRKEHTDLKSKKIRKASLP